MSKVVKVLLLALVVVGSASFLWTTADAGRPASVACTLDMVFELRAQDGTILSTQPYQNSFVVTEGVPFEDDFSTATRFKFMTASMEKVGKETIITINWFSDVTTFNSSDFTATLVMPNNQKEGRTSASNTYSTSSIFPNSGHATTSLSLSAVRN